MVASFSKMKDYKTFFETAKLINQMRDDVTFIAVGDGVYFDEYKNLYANERIIFTGKQIQPGCLTI